MYVNNKMLCSRVESSFFAALLVHGKDYFRLLFELHREGVWLRACWNWNMLGSTTARL